MKKTIFIFVILLTLGAGAVFGRTAVNAFIYSPDSGTETFEAPPLQQKNQPQRSAIVSGDFPVRIQIPSLKIDASVQQVGINGKGNVAAPSNYTDVGWYAYGTYPGDLGSAVIDGHVDNGVGLRGVFKYLDQVTVGDDVFVTTKAGSKLHFKVEEIRSYQYKNVPTDRVFNADDAVRLNLITCEGSWVKGDKTYDHRLVVYTKIAGS